MVKISKTIFVVTCVLLLNTFIAVFSSPSNANPLADKPLIEYLEQARTLGETDPVSAIEQLNKLSAVLNDSPVEAQLEYYHVLSELYGETGRHSQSKMASETGLKLSSQLPTPRIIIAKLFYSLGFALESLGALDIALEKYFAGLEVAETLEEQKEIAIGLINIGAIYYQTDRLSEAVITINDAAAIANQLSDLELKGFINSELGILYGNLGKYDKAEAYYLASYDFYKQAGKILAAINNLRNLGVSYANQEKHQQAINTFQRLLNELDDFDNKEMAFSAHMGMARIYGPEFLNDTEKALVHLEAAGELVTGVEQHYLAIQFLVNKAILLGDMKFFDKALDTTDQALTLFKAQQVKIQPMLEAVLLVRKALILHETGKHKAAYQAYERVFELNMQDMQNTKTEAIANLRLQYEARQADIDKSILEKQAQIESLAIADANRSANSRGYYVVILTVIAIIFAALLNQLLKSQRLLLRITRVDSLTGALTRERFIELFNRSVKSALKKQQPLSLLLIDCDHFKKINDSFGHETGDNVLKLLSRLALTKFQRPNMFGRYGGEEFLVGLPNCDKSQAVAIAQQLRTDISEQVWQNTESNHLLSVSIGVVSLDLSSDEDFEQLFNRADHLLYVAKDNGRNQVCS